jgi:hypothetical protein
VTKKFPARNQQSQYPFSLDRFIIMEHDKNSEPYQFLF